MKLLRIINRFTGSVEGEWSINHIDEVKKGLRAHGPLKILMLESESVHFQEMITDGKEKYIPCITKAYYVINV